MAGDRALRGNPAEQHADTSSVREPSADVYRVLAVVIVVIGHWLVSAVTFHDGEFGNDYPFALLPWTPWLTLVFQVVPVFFLVGGYASATAWTLWREVGGHRWTDWVRQRLAAILGPTTAYVVLVLATIAVLSKVGVERSPLSFGGWAVAMHLWFIPVYLVVVALTPVAVAAHRRWGLMVPAVLALAVVVVDAVARSVPEVGSANYLLCWGRCTRSESVGAVGNCEDAPPCSARFRQPFWWRCCSRCAATRSAWSGHLAQPSRTTSLRPWHCSRSPWRKPGSWSPRRPP